MYSGVHKVCVAALAAIVSDGIWVVICGDGVGGRTGGVLVMATGWG